MLLGSVGNGIGVLLLSNYYKLQISWLVFLVKLTEAGVWEFFQPIAFDTSPFGAWSEEVL